MKKILKYILIIIFTSLTLASCQDEFGQYEPIPDGESEMTMRVGFKSFTPALESRGAAGDAIKEFSTLWVVVYNTDGTLVEKKRITDFTVHKVQPNERPDTINPAEKETDHAEFRMRISNGRYRIYAVANYDLSGVNVDSENDLKNIQLTWKTGDVAQNGQMFGWFSTDEGDVDSATSFNAPVVTVKGSGSLHAWVRRAASKLTIVYDGSGLREGVFVYIKTAQIKDMPVNCLLGAPNDYNRINRKEMLMDGDTLKYYTGDTYPDDDFNYGVDYTNRVTSGGDPVGSHAETARALYFYENIQENGEEGTMSDKRQDTSGNNKQVSWPHGNDPNNPAWKDARPYGTYVEIKGYYISIAEGRISRGDITYRFMLGKDVVANYQAERNYHYKLTMKFNGYANDVDFHIDYRVPKPSLHIPPYYISYLYNHSMMLPVSISSGTKRVKKVQADIIENHWWPTGAKGSATNSPGDDEIYYNGNGMADPDNYQWHGFLSLRKTKTPVLTGAISPYDKTGSNAKYYFDNLRHSREYSDMSNGNHLKDNRTSAPANTSVIPNKYTEESDDYYIVDIDDSKSDSIVYDLQIPLYTRAKQMIKRSAYTGNNPYVAYQRTAKVHFKVWFVGNNDDNKPDLEETVPITQVRRIVNPKGIYRKAGSVEPFHVVLKYQPMERSSTFKDLVSEGPWSAEVLGDKIISLDKTTGKTGSKIDFNVKFSGAEGHAVIRVRYHNNSCIHLIYVCNGYDPVELLPGKAKWHTTNLHTKNKECVNPMDEGSLFKYGNLDNPIDASSNVNDKTPWLNVRATDFKDPRGKKLNIANDSYNKSTMSSKLWTDFWGIGATNAFVDGSTRKLGVSGRVAKLEDYNVLRESDDIGYGYGVLYADGATECANTIADAYGYRWDLTDNAEKSRGMRGVFIYNLNPSSTCYAHNIFLPIGNSGYGQRRPTGKYAWGETSANIGAYAWDFQNWGGMLKYTIRSNYYNNPYSLPLFWDMWKSPGAIYWLSEQKNIKLVTGESNDAAQNYLGWDINYMTFDFFGYTTGDLQGSATIPEGSPAGSTDTSACFIRLVD